MCYKPYVKFDKQANINSVLNKKGLCRFQEFSCRQCLECRQQRANEWAIRVWAESENYTKMCFITLTYAKAPRHLIKEDFQKFIKRLRKQTGVEIKYFGCGEYGKKRYRPHFHAIILGHQFDDLVPYKDLYTSDTLDKIWGQGMCTVGKVTKDSIAYCALYSSKSRKQLPKPYRRILKKITCRKAWGTIGYDVILRLLKLLVKCIMTAKRFFQ